MKNITLSLAIASVLVATPVWAQNNQLAAPKYDAQPFLSAMLHLRSTALDCDGFVDGGPAQRTASIDDYLTKLGMGDRKLVNETTRASLNKFIRSQAASICKDKLDIAYDDYEAAAKDYLASKPKNWPNPPSVSKTQWCANAHCTDL